MEVVVMPKMSFGTGHHATTWLVMACRCSTATCRRTAAGLDMGSGTGVLADRGRPARCRPRSMRSTSTNGPMRTAVENIRAERRRKHGSTPLLGDIGAIAGRRYDFIAANINRNILLAQLPAYAAALDAGGWLLMSGILEADVAPLSEAARAAGFSVTGHALRDGWARVDAVKN